MKPSRNKLNRRDLLAGITTIIAAPVIVRAPSLMAIPRRIRFRFLTNAEMREHLDIMAMRDRNMLLMTDTGVRFRGVPIRIRA